MILEQLEAGTNTVQIATSLTGGWTDISSIENFWKYRKAAKIKSTGKRAKRKEIRAEIKALYDATTWASLNAEEKKIVAKLNIENYTKRDEVLNHREKEESLQEERQEGVEVFTPPGVNDDLTQGYNRNDIITDSVNGKTWVCCDDSPSNAIWKEVGGGGVFGSEYQHIESLSESSTGSTTYVQKLQMTTTDLPSGNYMIMVSWDMGATQNRKNVKGRARLNDTGTYLATFDNLIDGSGDYVYVTVSAHHIKSLSGVNTIDIDYAKDGGNAKIRNANITLYRVS